MKRSNPNTRDTLLTLLRKHIGECVSARDDMTRTIEILLEAERKLLQEDDSSARAYQDEPEHLPYRIHTAYESGIVAPPGETMAPPAEEKRTPPVDEAEEIVLLEDDNSAWEASNPATQAPMEIPHLPEIPSREPGPPRRSKEPTLEPEELLLGEDAYSLVPEQARTPETSPHPEFSSPNQVDDHLQEDQIYLLDTEEAPPPVGHPSPESRTRQRTAKPALPFQQPFDPAEDLALPFRAPAGRRVVRRQTAARAAPVPRRSESPAASALPASLQRLMNYIRSGGAVRCLDPWNQNCAAFLLSSGGTAVFATDVFMNYLRKSLKTLRALLQESIAKSNLPSQNFHLSEELESRKQFLTALVGALQGQQTFGLHSVGGLRISGQTPLPETFEFEKSTINFIHTGLLGALHELLQKPADLFFQPGGSFSEIAEFLSKYKEFTHELGEEKQAEAMLRQLGLEENSSKPGTSGRPNPAGTRDTPGASSTRDQFEPTEDLFLPPDDTSSFMDEGEKLQDLNSFDFDPDDKKSIMRQKEQALSSSGFKKIEQAGQSSERSDSKQAGNGPNFGSISPAEDSTISSEEILDSSELTAEKDNSFDLEEFEKLLDDDEAESSPAK